MSQDAHSPSPSPPFVPSGPQKGPGRHILALVLVVALLASCGFVLVRNLFPPQTSISAASQEQTLDSQTTATLAAGATATSRLQTATVDTALAQTQQATQIFSSNPDPYGAGGRLIVFDPLTDASSDYSTDSLYRLHDVANEGCGFQQGSYHVKTEDGCSFLNMDYFALDIDMTIAGDGMGGLYFWSIGGKVGYRLLFDDQGDYALWCAFLTVRPFGTPISISGTDFGVVYEQVASGSSATFHAGNHQRNRIGLVVTGSTFTWYVNFVQAGHFLMSQAVAHSLPPSALSRPPSPGGDLGLTSTAASEVVFQHLRLWRL